MCGTAKNDKLAEVEMRIVDDNYCRSKAGSYQNWVEGEWVGVPGTKLESPQSFKTMWKPVCKTYQWKKINKNPCRLTARLNGVTLPT